MIFEGWLQCDPRKFLWEVNIVQDKFIFKLEWILPSLSLHSLLKLFLSILQLYSCINQSIQRTCYYRRPWRLCEKYSINVTVTLHRCTLATQVWGFFASVLDLPMSSLVILWTGKRILSSEKFHSFYFFTVYHVRQNAFRLKMTQHN